MLLKISLVEQQQLGLIILNIMDMLDVDQDLIRLYENKQAD